MYKQNKATRTAKKQPNHKAHRQTRIPNRVQAQGPNKLSPSHNPRRSRPLCHLPTAVAEEQPQETTAAPTSKHATVSRIPERPSTNPEGEWRRASPPAISSRADRRKHPAATQRKPSEQPDRRRRRRRVKIHLSSSSPNRVLAKGCISRSPIPARQNKEVDQRRGDEETSQI
ncbi:unnamed protein product [Linum trigynum]|uniref:Uncharacterized protein n=1 Tax=Linum trigynum TaxID=586398 RepID=A0AAV2F4N1_9ROSI